MHKLRTSSWGSVLFCWWEYGQRWNMLMMWLLWEPWDLAHLESQTEHQVSGNKEVVKENARGKGGGHEFWLYIYKFCLDLNLDLSSPPGIRKKVAFQLRNWSLEAGHICSYILYHLAPENLKYQGKKETGTWIVFLNHLKGLMPWLKGWSQYRGDILSPCFHTPFSKRSW